MRTISHQRSIEEVTKLLHRGIHFCVIPWIHLYVTALGYMGTCCAEKKGPHTLGHGNLNTRSFEELWQGESIRRFRLTLLRDEPSSQCEPCYEQEKCTGRSLRLLHNEQYGDKYIEWFLTTDENGFAPDAKPVYWDIRFSNRCNLRCRSCSIVASSGWTKDTQALLLHYPKRQHQQHAVISMKNPTKLIAELDRYFPFVQKVMFAGGEPFLIIENEYILKRLHELERFDVEVHYITNLTILRNTNFDLSTLLRHFKSLYITISLDAIDQRCEYLRKGMKWDVVLRNLEHIKIHCPNARIQVNFTVSAMNVIHAPDFHRKMVEDGHIQADMLLLNLLRDPSYYSVKILPPRMKRWAQEKIADHIDWLRGRLSCTSPDRLSQWEYCIRYMHEDDWTSLIPQFISFNDKLDKLRNESCLVVFPELEELYRFVTE